MARGLDDRKAFGSRLKAARKAANMTLEDVRQALTEQGVAGVSGRQTVSAWETGANVPDALVLKRLAKMYHQSADALLWENALSMEAMQFAAEYDSLTETQKRTLRAIWMAYITEANNGDGLPLPPGHMPSKTKEEHK